LSVRCYLMRRYVPRRVVRDGCSGR
jgi:hypothetical protein